MPDIQIQVNMLSRTVWLELRGSKLSKQQAKGCSDQWALSQLERKLEQGFVYA